MASKQAVRPISNSPPVTDDFCLIKGIGPILAHRLYDAGIRTYHQLASRLPHELAGQITGLSAKQIIRQDWMGQAEHLASKKKRSRLLKVHAAKQAIRQHYANFTLEFLLDEKNVIRRTRVNHIQSGETETWSGWQADPLIEFLIRYADLHLPASQRVNQGTRANIPQALSNGIYEHSPESLSPANLPTPCPESIQPPQADILAAIPVLQPSANTDLAGVLRLRDIRVMPAGWDVSSIFLRQGQPCVILLTLDLGEIDARTDNPLAYQVTVIFRKLGGPCSFVGKTSNACVLSNSITVTIHGTCPLPGTYRIEAVAKLFSDEPGSGLMASLRGNLLQVY